MRTVYIPIIVAVISFVVFFPLGILTRKWLNSILKGPCEHDWYVLIEKYPTFTENRWRCRDCGECKNFPDSQPPVKTTLEICNMGHMHTVVKAPTEWDEWPETVDWR